MSETLIGVLIGGVIASIAPITSLFFESRRWKIERQLEQLKEERRRLERLIEYVLPQLGRDMVQDSYSAHMTSDIVALMPKSVLDRFDEWMFEEDKDEVKSKQALFKIAVEMKKCLAEIDEKISNILNI